MTLADSILIEKRERLIGQFFTILLIGTVMLGNWNTPCDDFPVLLTTDSGKRYPITAIPATTNFDLGTNTHYST
jgi:hypothetical protein